MATGKLKLELDALTVQSFAPDESRARQHGTVHGHAVTLCKCNTQSCDAFDTLNANNCTDECGYSYLCGTGRCQ